MLAFGIFLFQMQNSFKKYYQGPVVQERVIVSKHLTKQPIFFVCQADQFNYTTALTNGYSGLINWAKGKLVDSKLITWKGKYGNITYDLLFDSDYSSFKSFLSETENRFLPNHGLCKMLTDSNSGVYVNAPMRSIVLIIDPYMENSLRVIEMERGRLYFGPTYDNLFDSSAYNVEYRFHDSKIHDGQSCTDYERLDSSYSDCIEDIMKSLFIESYGCLPPWFPSNKGMMCKIEKEILEDSKVILEDFIDFMLGRDVKLFKSCLPPCLKMSIGIKMTTYNIHQRSHAKICFRTKEEVIVYKDTYSYDVFNLGVDIGSALGLWLGLSVLCIFDNFMEFCSWLATRNCRLCKK